MDRQRGRRDGRRRREHGDRRRRRRDLTHPRQRRRGRRAGQGRPASVRVLFLTHRLPYAPNRGDRVRAFHLLRTLRTFAAVDLVSLVHDDDEAAHLDETRPLAETVTGVRVSRGRALIRSALALPTLARCRTRCSTPPACSPRSTSASPPHRPDVVFAFCTGIAHTVVRPPLSALPLVLDMVDVDSRSGPPWPPRRERRGRGSTRARRACWPGLKSRYEARVRDDPHDGKGARDAARARAAGADRRHSERRGRRVAAAARAARDVHDRGVLRGDELYAERGRCRVAGSGRLASRAPREAGRSLVARRIQPHPPGSGARQRVARHRGHGPRRRRAPAPVAGSGRRRAPAHGAWSAEQGARSGRRRLAHGRDARGPCRRTGGDHARLPRGRGRAGICRRSAEAPGRISGSAPSPRRACRCRFHDVGAPAEPTRGDSG